MNSGEKSGPGRASSEGGAGFSFAGHGGHGSIQDDHILASMFEAFPDAIYLADRQTGLLIDVNPAGERLIKRSRKEIIGMHQSLLHPPQLDETSRRLFAEHAQKLSQGEAVQFEAVRSDGVRIPVEITGRVIRVEGRDALMGVFRDITERTRVQEKLGENLRLIEAINQAQLGYIAGKDSREVFYHLLETMRQAAECEFGVIMELFQEDGDAGKQLRCLAITEVPMDGDKSVDGPKFTDFDHLLCAPVKRGGMVIENILPEGQSYCGIPGCCMNIRNYMGLPIFKGEEIIGLIGFANRNGGFSPDLAGSLQPVLSTLANIIIGAGIRRQRRKAQMELVKAKEVAEEATRLKDQFISIIAHDLRAPFTSILGFMRLLESDLQGKIGDRQMSTIRAAIQGGEHMIDMIDGLLDVSRLKTGKVQVRPQFVDIRQVAAASAAGVSVMAEEKNVRIANLAPEGTRVWADPALYGVVIQNLLSNAVKFSKPGDEVAIFVPEESGTALAVKDSGCGVPETFASALFRHEVKTTSPGTGGEQGTGLGLPYSADIMKAHGGRIWYESSHEGSVFYTMLPYVRPKALVIDSSPVARAMARAFLEGMDVEVAESGDGAEGLEMARRIRPHLVVVDIYTPGISGLDVISKLKDGKDAGAPAIIAITSDSATSVREQALRAGAGDFTTKPLAANEFVPRVRRFIG